MLKSHITVRLSGGTVVLRQWGNHVFEAYLQDALTLSETLRVLRTEWQEFTRQDIEDGVWAAFWRLVHASLDTGSVLPHKITWLDRWTLLEAILEVNELEQAAVKMDALSLRTTRLLTAQGHPTATMKPSFGHSA